MTQTKLTNQLQIARQTRQLLQFWQTQISQSSLTKLINRQPIKLINKQLTKPIKIRLIKPINKHPIKLINKQPIKQVPHNNLQTRQITRPPPRIAKTLTKTQLHKLKPTSRQAQTQLKIQTKLKTQLLRATIRLKLSKRKSNSELSIMTLITGHQKSNFSVIKIHTRQFLWQMLDRHQTYKACSKKRSQIMTLHLLLSPVPILSHYQTKWVT